MAKLKVAELNNDNSEIEGLQNMIRNLVKE